MSSYALIIVPPKRILGFVDGFRKKYAKYTNYAIPPHITVYPPFFIKDSSEEIIIDSLVKSFRQVEPQKVTFKSIDYFEGKNNVALFSPDKKSVAFIKDLLIRATELLGNKVKNVYDDYNFSPRKFKPHMTIAEKIPDDTLAEVKKELDKTQEILTFDVKSVCLYKQEGNLKMWRKLREINFRQKQE
jgi:2'-5' RNA ligase